VAWVIDQLTFGVLRCLCGCAYLSMRWSIRFISLANSASRDIMPGLDSSCTEYINASFAPFIAQCIDIALRLVGCLLALFTLFIRVALFTPFMYPVPSFGCLPLLNIIL
jgi:hypothetical protein